MIDIPEDPAKESKLLIDIEEEFQKQEKEFQKQIFIKGKKVEERIDISKLSVVVQEKLLNAEKNKRKVRKKAGKTGSGDSGIMNVEEMKKSAL